MWSPLLLFCPPSLKKAGDVLQRSTLSGEAPPKRWFATKTCLCRGRVVSRLQILPLHTICFWLGLEGEMGNVLMLSGPSELWESCTGLALFWAQLGPWGFEPGERASTDLPCSCCGFSPVHPGTGGFSPVHSGTGAAAQPGGRITESFCLEKTLKMIKSSH